ncbi:hypothetical protein BDP27DRAFT_1361046 [Rhodocollybia butyracea]|uniref:Uncharacterized protein n=1 Tax=Rhodocollybia butyracea TaxID=206335 RepID=A0A9P5UAX0_9AGAR|nr:hypothetical protein BDP27DRAFT_1361046 [Rhodocollybia butyracea]
MPAWGENQAFGIDVQDSVRQVRAKRVRNGDVLETTMRFRTSADSVTRVRAENASRIRIAVTGPKPWEEEEDGFEATAFARSHYNLNTSITITNDDVNFALNPLDRRPVVRFVSVGPISEEELSLMPGEAPSVEYASEAKAESRPVSALVPSAEFVTAVLDAPLTPLISARPGAPLRIITNPLLLQHSGDVDSEVDSPLNSPPITSFHPHQFGGRSSLPLRRLVLDEPLPSLCARSPSESSFVEPTIPEEHVEVEGRTEASLASHIFPDSLENQASAENTVEGAVSLPGGVHSHVSTTRPQRKSIAISLSKAVKQKLYGSTSLQTSSPSSPAVGRSSMSPPPSAFFQRFERALGAGSGSSVSLSSTSSKYANATNSGKKVKALLGKAMAIGKGLKRSWEDDENVRPDEAKDASDRPIVGRRTKRKLRGLSVGY